MTQYHPGRWNCSLCGSSQIRRPEEMKREICETCSDMTQEERIAEEKKQRETIRRNSKKINANILNKCLFNRRIDERKIVSFDAESDGLYGGIFWIGAVVMEYGVVTDVFNETFKTEIKDEWCKKNVIRPVANDIHIPHAVLPPHYHDNYNDLLKSFSEFYIAYKNDRDIVTHMGYIVESKLIRDMVDCGFIGPFDGPYPLFDVSGNLQSAGEDPTSVDGYAKKHSLIFQRPEYFKHNPVYDAAISGIAYANLNCNKPIWNKIKDIFI